MKERLVLSGEELEFEDFLLLNPAGRQRLALKYKDNAFEPVFDWDWVATPYNRAALVNLLAQRIGADCRYLEIGCNLDELFAAIPLKAKVGVDPVKGGNRKMTSDRFFALNSDRFDVIFIDGLHTYEQLHRDVVNALRVVAPGGFIVLHDMLPRDWKEEHVPRLHGQWTGDVWKVGFELAQSAGINFRVVLIDYGVGILRAPPDPGATVADLRQTLEPMRFPYFHQNIDVLTKLTWEEFLDWVSRADGGAT